MLLSHSQRHEPILGILHALGLLYPASGISDVLSEAQSHPLRTHCARTQTDMLGNTSGRTAFHSVDSQYILNMCHAAI